MKYKVKLLDRHEVAAGTMKFTIEKPEGFEFKAGQFMDITIPNPAENDAEGSTRAFSITEAPFEKNISFTTRMRDTAFKRNIKNMPLGTQLEIDAPHGSFTLQNDSSKPAVFLAGGIGITPMFSIIKNASHQKLPHKIYLFYSNRTPNDAAYLNELTGLTKENPNFTLIATMTSLENPQQQWSGETGYINAEMLRKYIKEGLDKPIYYLAGPATMVAAMRQLLESAGINEDYIRTEEFSGY